VLRDAHDEFHVVLDQQHADAGRGDALQQRGKLRLVFARQARRGLVEQQQPAAMMASARASSSSFWRPKSRSRAGWWRSSARPTRSSRCMAKSSVARSGRRSSRPSVPAPREWVPSSTFSSTDSSANSSRFWKVRAMPSEAMRCGDTLVSSRPSKVTLPLLGV
jgi:hypothetical protein